MPDLAYINHSNKIVPLEEATVSVLDRGFLFADAVYEVLRVYDRIPFYFDEHLQRLEKNLNSLEINIQAISGLQKILERMIQKSDYNDSRIYIQISRGAAKRQLSFPSNITPTLVVFIEKLDVNQISDWQRHGVDLISVPDTRWARCDLKTTGLLSNVLAQQEAVKAGVFDSLLVDKSGFVRETTHASFFAIIQGKLIVPPPHDFLLPGITRNIVLKLVHQMNIPVSLRQPTINEIYLSQESFITATTAEIIPVNQIDNVKISENNSGKITEKLQVEYKNHVKKWLEKTVKNL